jgi:Cd2+/Zn2+-exporting ATPase/Cu+-exporting ATPase
MSAQDAPVETASVPRPPEPGQRAASASDPPHEHEDDHEAHGVSLPDLALIAAVALSALASWLKLWEHFASFDVIALTATLVGGIPIFKEAFGSLLARRMTMELSMTIALASALAIHEFQTAVVIVLFVLIAEVLEHLTVGRGRQAIGALLSKLPRTAFVRRDGAGVEVPIEDVTQGDVVVVKPGAALPVDGAVVSGHSFVDQASITGESFPVEKVTGSRVFAGTMNQTGTLDVRTERVGRDTAFGKIVEAVERAEKSRAPIQKTADRLAGYLVYFALAAAALTFAVTRDARSTISVVIVAGACGIAAGTPLAILGALGRSAAAGAIVKGGLYLEILGQVDTVVLDKTGTLTLGKPEVVEVVAVGGVTLEQVVEAAAIAERPSEHPIAKAILAKARALSLEPTEPESFGYTPGGGVVVTASGDEIVVGNRSFVEARAIDVAPAAPAPAHTSEVLVARGGKLLGGIRVADVLRPEAVRAVKALGALGLRTILLTGDADAVAQDAGRQLGVDEIGADLLPEQKLARVKALVGGGRKVAMVGDGVNDAPALMEANVGIAMGSGTDVARESARVLLLGDDLMTLVETLGIARRCHRIIMQNFVGTLVVDGAGVLLAAFGFLNPLLAAFIHVSSELAFILNSTRLLPRLRASEVARRGT